MAKDKNKGSTKSKESKHRDALTGKFVTKQFAEKHPKTTFAEKSSKGGTDHTGPRRKK